MGGRVVHPAQVPLRAFPRVLVVAPPDDESVQLAERLARHLDGGSAEVRRESVAAVETLRARGALGPGTVVVSVRAALARDDRPAWGRRDVLECGPLGCIESQRPIVADVPVVVGRLRLTVTDGPRGNPLQRAAFEEEEAGPDVLGARLRVLERLGERMTALVDPRSERVTIELVPVEVPAVRRALALVAQGEWAHGAAMLARFTRSRRFAALPPAERARVLYDLGQARRFDPSLPPDERFASAAEALRRAVRLVPDARYAAAIAELDAQRRSGAALRAQEEARTHNFRLARGGGEAIPEPPASYR